MATARHYDTILSPVITEKATLLTEQNKVVFQVAKDATKDEIAAAVEELFKVRVIKVNTLITKGKTKKFRGRPGVKGHRRGGPGLRERFHDTPPLRKDGPAPACRSSCAAAAATGPVPGRCLGLGRGRELGKAPSEMLGAARSAPGHGRQGEGRPPSSLSHRC